jgi:hypothetical protein
VFDTVACSQSRQRNIEFESMVDKRVFGILSSREHVPSWPRGHHPRARARWKSEVGLLVVHPLTTTAD